MEALATWQNRTLCKMTSTHQAKEIRVTIWFVDNNLQFNFAYKPGIPKVRAIKHDTSAAPLDPSVSMVVHGTLMYLNLTFMNWYYRTGILIRYVNYLPSINFARYAQPILETVNSRLEAFIHELSIVCPSFIPAPSRWTFGKCSTYSWTSLRCEILLDTCF